MGGRKDYEQKKGVRKREVLGKIEGLHSQGGHLGKQGELEEYNGFSRGIQERISKRRRRRSEMARRKGKQEDV